MSLTDPRFLAKLESLHLLARRVIGGELAADRRSKKMGSGIHFADYAQYQPGDDYRLIDWKIYARLNHLVLKLFELEEDVSIHLILDISRSMEAKLDLAVQLTAALGYIALSNQDRLTIYGLCDKLKPIMETSHGKNAIMKMLMELDKVEVAGSDSCFNEAVRLHQSQHSRHAVVVVLSDFFFPGGYQEGLRLLRYAKHDVFCLQVLDPQETSCDLQGDLELNCVETGVTRQITIGPQERQRFIEVVEEWNRGLEHSCSRYEMGFMRAQTDTAFEDIIQNLLRRGGLVT